MRVLKAYLSFVFGDPLLNLGAAGTAFFGVGFIFNATAGAALQPLSLVFLVLSIYFVRLFSRLGGGLIELRSYMAEYATLSTGVAYSPVSAKTLPSRREITGIQRAIEDWRDARGRT